MRGKIASQMCLAEEQGEEREYRGGTCTNEYVYTCTLRREGGGRRGRGGDGEGEGRE